MENKLNSLLEKIQQQQPDFSFDRNKIEEEIESKSTIFSHIGIKLLSVIGGILGSVFFLGFLASIVFDSPRGCIIFGSLFIIGSVVIHKISHSILLDTGIICLYLAGALLLGYGLNSEHVGDNGLAFIALIISLIVLFLSQGFMLAFLSLLIANSALLSFVFINDAYNLLHLYMLYVIVVFSLLTYSEAWIVSQKLAISRLYNPVRSGFLITFIFTLLVFSENYLLRDRMHFPWVSSTLLIISILLVINHILNSFKVNKPQIRLGYYLVSTLILLPEIFAPAILGSLFIILISFHYGHRTGFFTGIIALIYFISRYYYDLKLSLLVKSEILMASGLLFIIVFLALKKYLLKDENQEPDYTA